MNVYPRTKKTREVLLLLVPVVLGAAGAFWWQYQSLPSTEPEGPRDINRTWLSYFDDVTAGSGIAFMHRNGEEANHCTLLESLGGGVALFDYDGDGLLDIFLTGGGHFTGPDRKQIRGYPGKLYKNLGDWKFRDVTADTGLDRVVFYSHGAAVGDYDRDGWPDLLITGYGRLALMHNESDGRGGRRFVEVTGPAHLDDHEWSSSAAWADVDGDGYPDLYICHYVEWSWKAHRVCRGDSSFVERDLCAPETFEGTPHRLYHNNGDGTFTDVSRDAGIRLEKTESGKGLGVVVVDVNNDGRPDIYAVNDTVRNFLYVNKSERGRPSFTEIGLPGGVAMGDRGAPDGSMGVDAADYDGSGRASLWVTTFERELPALYRNDSEADRVLFTYATRLSGVSALGSAYVGFGTAFLDVDLDGWEDLVAINGHVRRYPSYCPLRQRPFLLRNQGDGKFVNVTLQGGDYFHVVHRGRGLAVGDLDNDGRPDLVLSHLNEPVVLLRNAPDEAKVPRRHWLGLELLGRKHRDIAGARVIVESGGRRLTRFAKGGGSYLSTSDPRLLFGLDDLDRVERITVFWPWGEQQQWEGLAVDRYWRLTEGDLKARERKP
jgi:hypothetical protein